MRSSRLVALLLCVQRDHRTTAPALAAELGVSVRTIYRDVQALQLAGAPLYALQGAGGGIGIVERWRSPVEGLSPDEVTALGLGGAAAADLGLGAVLAVARSKLRSGLPARVQAQLDVVNQRVLLDTTGWFSPAVPEQALGDLARAVWSGHRVDVRYRRGGGTVARRLDPLGLVLKAGRWYLVAAHRGAPRTYRTSRVERATVRAEAVVRPDGFDLQRYWQAAADAFDADLRRLRVRLVLPARSLPDLLRHVPGRLTASAVHDAAELPGGRVEVRLGLEGVDVAADQLCAVPGVQVLDPPELRERLAELGEQLVRVHRGAPAAGADARRAGT
ncbi:helix-turn-helix transcriptional regulator [Kineococcus sp. SYSU DK005]|uniref:helix-turn-helix transcriptional regulator n=1 Tax=Kineococcus sp. SYSU DK005 TaxID=3383126 RepID=UPI003D7D2BB3